MLPYGYNYMDSFTLLLILGLVDMVLFVVTPEFHLYGISKPEMRCHHLVQWHRTYEANTTIRHYHDCRGRDFSLPRYCDLYIGHYDPYFDEDPEYYRKYYEGVYFKYGYRYDQCESFTYDIDYAPEHCDGPIGWQVYVHDIPIYLWKASCYVSGIFY